MARPDRNQKRMQQVQMLTQLAALSDQFSPAQETRDQLQQEQLLAFIQGREQQAQLNPLQVQQLQAHVAGLTQANEHSGVMNPLLQGQERTRMQGLQLDHRFNEESFEPRIAALRAQAQQAGTLADITQQTKPDVVAQAGLQTQGLQRGLEEGFARIQNIRTQNDAARQGLNFARDMQPLKQVELGADTASRLQMMGMGQAQVPDVFKMLSQQGINIPMMPAPQQAGQEAPPWMQTDRMLSAGMFPQGEGAPAWYQANLPQLMSQMQADPEYSWSDAALGLQDYMENPGEYGFETADMRNLDPAFLQQLIAEIQQRRNNPNGN